MKYNKKRDKELKEVISSHGRSIMVSPERFEKEKRILVKTEKYKSATNEEIIGIIQAKIFKEITKRHEKPDYGHRNFILPSYHSKTHFKAAQSIQMQTENSLIGTERYYRGEFKLANDTSGNFTKKRKLSENSESLSPVGANKYEEKHITITEDAEPQYANVKP